MIGDLGEDTTEAIAETFNQLCRFRTARIVKCNMNKELFSLIVCVAGNFSAQVLHLIEERRDEVEVANVKGFIEFKTTRLFAEAVW